MPSMMALQKTKNLVCKLVGSKGRKKNMLLVKLKKSPDMPCMKRVYRDK